MVKTRGINFGKLCIMPLTVKVKSESVLFIVCNINLTSIPWLTKMFRLVFGANLIKGPMTKPVIETWLIILVYYKFSTSAYSASHH